MKYKTIKDKPTGLLRIIALRDISSLQVKKGDKGGLIELESNLSQEGNAWVSGDARVYGTAQVCDNAQVYGNAQVSGNARVYGNAWVSGDARVYGDAWVSGNARVYGDAWVSGNARVYGTAQVYGYAQVYGNAQVSGNARVYGNAWVSGDARVYGNAQVYGNARVYGDAWSRSPLYVQGTKHSITNCNKGYLRIGCLVHTVDHWLKHYKQIGKNNGFTPIEIKEYGEYIKLFKKLGC